jgi:hypothetical protein
MHSKKLDRELSRKVITTGVIIVVIAYVALFSSRLWMPSQAILKEDVPRAGSVIEYMDGRTATFISATFSPSQRILEVAMQLTNSTLDGVNTYYFAAKAAGSDEEYPEVREVFAAWLMTVVRIEVDRFEELKLYFAPRIGELKDISDDQTGTIILNKYNVTDGEINTAKTEKEYLTERIAVIIEGYKSELAEHQKKHNRLTEEINELTKMNEELKANEAFMTAEEISEAENQITGNLNTIATKTKDRYETEAEITETEQKIAEAEERKGSL